MQFLRQRVAQHRLMQLHVQQGAQGTLAHVRHASGPAAVDIAQDETAIDPRARSVLAFW